MLSKEDFRELVIKAPLVSIDLLVRNDEGKILLGYRKNAPAKNKWFVPGGCIVKNETFNKAFNRITKNELTIEYNIYDAELFATNSHIYKNENLFEEEGIDTHYVVITYLIDNFPNIDLKEDSQHFKFKWMTINELLNNNNVHENTKILFK